MAESVLRLWMEEATSRQSTEVSEKPVASVFRVEE
jgi:hypothetical protein